MPVVKAADDTYFFLTKRCNAGEPRVHRTLIAIVSYSHMGPFQSL